MKKRKTPRKKISKTHFEYVVPLYCVGMDVYLCKYEDLPDFIKEPDIHNDNALAGFASVQSERGKAKRIVIWVDKFAWTPSSMATLVHEFSHAVDKVAEYVGTTLDTESRAYMLGEITEYYFRKIGKEYYTPRKPRKKKK